MKSLLKLSCLVSFVVAAGCSGEMQGMVRGEGTRVQFQYEQGFEKDFYKANIDGEAFEGQAVYADARSGVGTAFGTGFPTTVLTSTTSGNLVATMFGNRGSTLRCQMNYASSFGETSAGGVGVCNHSDGRIIDVMW